MNYLLFYLISFIIVTKIDLINSRKNTIFDEIYFYNFTKCTLFCIRDADFNSFLQRHMINVWHFHLRHQLLDQKLNYPINFGIGDFQLQRRSVYRRLCSVIHASSKFGFYCTWIYILLLVSWLSVKMPPGNPTHFLCWIRICCRIQTNIKWRYHTSDR